MRVKLVGNKECYEKLVIDFLVIYGYFKVKLNVCKILW